MIEYKEAEISDKEWVDSLLRLSDYRGTEYCFTNIFVWRVVYGTRIARWNDFLLFRADDGGGPYDIFPGGTGDVKSLIDKLMNDSFQERRDFRMAVVGAEKATILQQLYPTGLFEVTSERNSWDYIYKVEDLTFLHGKHYQTKRNHIARFAELPDWQYETITPQNLAECIEMNTLWSQQMGCTCNRTLPAREEMPSARDYSDEMPSVRDYSDETPSVRDDSDEMRSARDYSDETPSVRDETLSIRDDSHEMPSTRDETPSAYGEMSFAREETSFTREEMPSTRDYSDETPSVRDETLSIRDETSSARNRSRHNYNQSLNDESCAVEMGLRHFEALRLEGALLRVAGKVVAFTIGEPLNSDTYIVHVEKAFPQFRGAYQMINREFIRHNAASFTYVNREDDAGDDGLRTAKNSYHPAFMEEKYFFTIPYHTL